MEEEKYNYFVGVDVGTKSVRAALLSEFGCILCVDVIPISVYNPRPDFYEQSSDEIWKAVCTSVQKVVGTVNKSYIKGIGFTGTCSLVVLGRDFQPVSVSTDQNDRNVILWMDHRAKTETEKINSKPYKFLKYVGGKISLEMQMPKLLWLKNNSPETWKSAHHFLDLPDYLTFRATGSLSRSLCSLVCKWTYESEGGWDDQFLADVGLEDLAGDDHDKIGRSCLSPGDLVGVVSKEGALDLGVGVHVAVGASIVDAHAGALALMRAGLPKEEEGEDMCGRMGLISGTSTCHMVLSREPQFVPGVWGPYLGAMVPGLWLSEGGQSATGALVDHVVLNHPAAKLCPSGESVYAWLERELLRLKSERGLADVSLLTDLVHVYPDFHGNRSPLADPSMRGMICGLPLEAGVESLALLFLATMQALAYGTKDIVDQMTRSGHNIHTVLICGGLSHSRVFVQINADVLEVPVLIPQTKESVLLGASMLGGAASGVFGARGDLKAVAGAMAGCADPFKPRPEMRTFHSQKFKVFKKMQEDQACYTRIMQS